VWHAVSSSGSLLGQPRAAGQTSAGHFSVDGTLIEAWASHKSLRAKHGRDDDKPDGAGRNAGDAAVEVPVNFKWILNRRFRRGIPGNSSVNSMTC
jgi:hypothetical protein